MLLFEFVVMPEAVWTLDARSLLSVQLQRQWKSIQHTVSGQWQPGSVGGSSALAVPMAARGSYLGSGVDLPGVPVTTNCWFVDKVKGG